MGVGNFVVICSSLVGGRADWPKLHMASGLAISNF